MSIGIYKIENLINHKVYIGQSIHIERRWSEHCRNSQKSLIAKAIKKYGKENFQFQILEYVENVELLNNLEVFYICKYNSLVPNGYNIVTKDNKEHHRFTAYNYNVFQSIIYDIKYSSLSFLDISQKYNLDCSTIYYINRGDIHKIFGEKYPLRELIINARKPNYCKNCNVEISRTATYCIDCSYKAQRKAKRPTREELKLLIRENSFLSVGKKYGISDNTIRKWCKSYTLPIKKAEIKKYSDEEWLNI